MNIYQPKLETMLYIAMINLMLNYQTHSLRGSNSCLLEYGHCGFRIFPELPWRLMSNMRNLIAHEYFRVDREIIWDTIQNNIPKLIEPLQNLLNSEEIL